MVISTTRVQGSANEVLISPERSAAVISSLANAGTAQDCAAPAGQKGLDAICQEAVEQARAGADIIEVTAVGLGDDEATCLPALVEMVARAVPTPLCIGARDPKSLDAALAVCPGKPIAFMLDQRPETWVDFLSVARRRGAAVIIQAVEPDGKPGPLDLRADTARRILRESIAKGIPREDVILDTVVRPIVGDETAASVALKVAARVAQLDCVNLTLRISPALTGLADADLLGAGLIARALAAGVTCPIVATPAQRRAVWLANLLMGHPGALRKYQDGIATGR
jgi:5-methyltetrahydrofolate--homocysteine methyltransferase